MRRLFPAIRDNARARDLARIIAGWSPPLRPLAPVEGPCLIARLVAAYRGALPCVLVAHDIATLREMLPAGLTRSPRIPADAPEMLELWYTAGP